MSDVTISNDILLIEHCQQGDRAAFDLLVRKYERKAYQFAYRLCNGNSEDASDVVAEAFVRVYTNIKSFRREASFTTWLYRIITNIYLDLRKRERVRAHESLEEVYSVKEGEVTRQVEDPNAGPQQLAETSEQHRALHWAISQLPDYQRAMVLMYHMDGMAYEEIAEVMELPLGTVKSRLNRARLALKEILSQQKELFGL